MDPYRLRSRSTKSGSRAARCTSNPDEPAMRDGRVMARRICYGLLALSAAVSPAAAQSAAAPGAITRSGVVTLGTGTSGPTGFPATYTNPAATQPASGTTSPGNSGTGSVAGAASGGGGSAARSSMIGTAGATSPSGPISRGFSATATTAPPSGTPAWVLCPPSDASGLQPFLTGTDLSCPP